MSLVSATREGVRIPAVLLLVWATMSVLGAGAPGWIDMNENEGYTARHECSFVQAGDRFYLFGGRENARTLDTYDYASDSWTTSAMAPIEFNHFQATEYQGLIWIIGAFKTNSFPNESPAEDIWVFDPARDEWIQGPSIPAGRRRGSTGLVVHDDKFYVVAGNTMGHNGGYVPWFDEYDPQTGDWTALTDAPGARDHFHAAASGDKLYAVGGRLSGGPDGTFAPLIAEVDVYDFTTASWSRLAATSNLPTPRAASAVAVFGGEILVAGGEGNGQAYDTVEGFDPSSNIWSPRASLNFARHGTQAIVSGQGVYVTAGSPSQGGGNQRNMEVYNADAPSGVPSIAGMLSAPAGTLISATSPSTIVLTHDSGNEGVFVNDVTLTGVDAADFTIVSDVVDPFLIRTSGSRGIVVEYSGASEGASASLDVTYGNIDFLTVSLTGTQNSGVPGRSSALLVDKVGTDLDLLWDGDCGGGDRFGIYRGDLALGYNSLAIDTCDVVGNSATISIGPADGEFFLVVPSVGSFEGSYGHGAGCAERMAALVGCHPPTLPDPCAAGCGGR